MPKKNIFPKKNPAVSVIVPVYKVERYIKICVDSILNQTFQDFEIILVDDASPDKSFEICRELYGDNKKIRIIRHGENLGLGAARNTGIANSLGRYIYFVDSDDALLPNALEVLFNAAQSSAAEVVHMSSWYMTWQDDGEKIQTAGLSRQPEGGNLLEGFLTTDLSARLIEGWGKYGLWPMAWLNMYEKSFLLKNNFRFQPVLSEDELFSFEIYCAAKKIFCVSEPLYVYRRREGSIMLSVTPEKFAKVFSYMNFGLKYLESVMKKIPELAENKIAQETIFDMHFEKTFQSHITKFFQREDLGDLLSQTLKEIFGENSLHARIWIQKFFALYVQNVNLRQQNSLLQGQTQMLAKYFFDNEKPKMLKLIDELKREEKRILLFGTPIHGNLGDQAITLGEYKILEKNFPEQKIIEIPFHYLSGDLYEIFSGLGFKKLVRESDIIFCQGGGNLGSLYPEEEIARRNLVENFPANKIVIFPQSIFFSADAAGKNFLAESQRIYNSHSNLHMILRDRESFDFAKKFFPKINLYLTPDSATSLAEIFEEKSTRGGGGKVIFILRRDQEKILDGAAIKNLQDFLSDKKISFEVTDTVIEENIFPEEREEKVLEILKKIRRHDLVITDRFHGVIFSVVTRTPVLAFKSFDTKISSGIKWFENNPAVLFAEGKSDSEIKNFVLQAFEGKIKFSAAQNFEKIFSDTLEKIIGGGVLS